ncbi:glycosyltransferase family 2 protein [candidate division NPL-UPA2 bacterium]|nr:glycosyltransferase family 2 protein [candidate division NPL-UPA2 bacterium]
MSFKSKKVQVLLSTYNGQKYLKELMDSVLNQDYLNLEILVRDDGSSDDTLNILTRYSDLKNVQVLRGKNLGVIKSFFKLLQLSSPDAEYVAFCDQDDVWEEDKISRAISLLGEYSKSIPTMYCSRVTIVDEKLKTIGYSQIPKHKPSFNNALVQNIAAGCTMIINDATRQLITRKFPLLSSVGMYDWWIYQVVSAFGKVIYDDKYKILYRQHSLNVIGEKSGFVGPWVEKIRRFLKQGGIPLVTIQAKEFGRIYRAFLPENKRAVLDRFMNERKTFLNRFQYAVNGEVYRQSKIDDIIFKILIILDRV